jgi:chaperonin cofactor prefoldin
VLAAILAGLCWFIYPYALRQTWLADTVPAVQRSVADFGNRIGRTEAAVREWSGDRQKLRESLDKAQSSLEARLRNARLQAKELAEAVYLRAVAEMDRRSERIEQRFSRVEAAEETSQARLARLESGLSSMREQLAAQSGKLAALEESTARDRESFEQRSEAADRNAEQSRQELSRLSRSVDRKRVTFELAKNRSEELAPGILLCVTGTDVSFRRVKGWLWIGSDRKTIWLRDHPAQQPLIFYSDRDGKRRELVFTQIGKNSAAGYFLLPPDEAAEAHSRPSPAQQNVGD